MRTRAAAYARITTMAITASFSDTVFGDPLDNTIPLRRDATGESLVNNLVVFGGAPTVANICLIQVFALGGIDRHLQRPFWWMDGMAVCGARGATGCDSILLPGRSAWHGDGA